MGAAEGLAGSESILPLDLRRSTRAWKPAFGFLPRRPTSALPGRVGTSQPKKPGEKLLPRYTSTLSACDAASACIPIVE